MVNPSLSGSRSIDDAARLLFNICPDEVRENGFDSPESFACLLHRNTFLMHIVKGAALTKDFGSIWKRCLRETSVETPPFSLETPSTMLNRISSRLAHVVTGRIDSPLWTLSKTAWGDARTPIRSFSLDTLMEERTMPSMLFYDLGSFIERPVLKERLRDLFVMGRNTFLVNASATGKTRLLYEGLFQNWGIYVTARPDDCEARALHAAIHKSLAGDDEIVDFLPVKTALGYQRLLNDNHERLNRRFSIVLLVHLYIFREFLKSSHAERVIDNPGLRRLWFLAQVCSTFLDEGSDMYKELLLILEWKPSAFIHEELASVMQEIKPLLPDAVKSKGLFVAIDEANVAIKRIWWDPAEDHPALKNLIRTWQHHLAALDCPITFIIAGTEIPMDAFPSASPEWSNWMWTSNTGSFDTPDAQREFILPFLPPSFPETPSGKVFIERVWNWCRPRHRLTTSLIRMLIEDKLKHPHSVLNHYIRRLVTYDATDGDQFVKVEGISEVRPFFAAIDRLIDRDELAHSAVHEAIFHYIITGTHPPSYGISRINLVTRGVGQFKDEAMQVIAMDQPGPTIAAAMWLGKDDDSNPYEVKDPRSLRLFAPFSQIFNLRWPNNDGYSSAGYIALYLTHALVGGREMTDMFVLPTPLWLGDPSSMAYLVVLRKGETGDIQEKIVDPSDLLPNAPPLGYRASSTEEVVAWLRLEHVGAFCLCPPGFPADLIFTLKIREKYVWVVLRAAGQGVTLGTQDLKTEFEKLSQENLFPLTDANTCREDFLDALDALPNSLAPPATFPFLRVLASFPDEPQLPRGNLAQRLPGGPVAVLKLDTFKEVTESFSSDDLVERLIASMHNKRLSYSDATFVSIEPMVRLPRKKPAASKSVVKSGTSQPKGPSHSQRRTRSTPRSKITSRPTPTTVPSSVSRQIAKEPARPSAPKRVKRDIETKGSESESSGPQLRRSPRKRHTT